jgi:superfamily II DNA helicase RecQ
MAFKFFTVTIQQPDPAAAELNAFLQSHRVLTVDRRWVDLGAESFWSFCVDYLDRTAAADARGPAGEKRSKVDYKEVLAPDQFSVFAKLRELRREIAQSEAVPVYTIFTNDQLARMVQARAANKSDLEKIAGVGNARVEKYGNRVLSLLQAQWSRPDAPDGKPV